jgi:CRP-like cAMP-binding protein
MSGAMESSEETTPVNTQGVAMPPQWLRRLEAGAILFREGDVDRRVFVLLEGRVEIAKEGRAIADLGVADSFIGEISALTGKPRWATARTIVASTLLVVNDVSELFRAGSTWGLKLAEALAQRLDRTNERLKRVQTLLDETRTRDTDPTLVETVKNAIQDAREY